ncbi:DMT family transporter [Aerobium aerolatum]|uniref:Permease of the drug/metabolite transporter (DMT) superfamily n=1 Tax=Aquamicrobium aerolatum DSM 21857 TaxID=1121003 RepID=A0A1I3MN50_9HYPH|nr:DMT family transporter [Aquamicrobium aerolatum]SFI98427.1 Permease of the drug/metabolite transporter (DMT) superfamily [Aquamicrobium aerolatum DSM 21857]
MLVIAAFFLFSMLDASAKYLVLSGLEPPFVAWVRFAVHLVLVLILFRGWSNPLLFRSDAKMAQFLRGLFLFGSTIFNFFALQSLQLAQTVSIGFFGPMLVTALAGPFLGEWAGWRRWMAVLVGFVGVLVITRPGLGAFGIGHLFSIMAMTSQSIYVIMTRKMGATESSESLIFYSALAPALFMLPAVPIYGSIPQQPIQWALLLGLGFFGGFGHYLLIRAYKIATTSALAPYPYSQMLWMIALGWLIFNDLPDLWTVVGASIIVASGLYILHREHRLRLANRTTPHGETDHLAKKL